MKRPVQGWQSPVAKMGLCKTFVKCRDCIAHRPLEFKCYAHLRIGGAR